MFFYQFFCNVPLSADEFGPLDDFVLPQRVIEGWGLMMIMVRRSQGHFGRHSHSFVEVFHIHSGQRIRITTVCFVECFRMGGIICLADGSGPDYMAIFKKDNMLFRAQSFAQPMAVVPPVDQGAADDFPTQAMHDRGPKREHFCFVRLFAQSFPGGPAIPSWLEFIQEVSTMSYQPLE